MSIALSDKDLFEPDRKWPRRVLAAGLDLHWSRNRGRRMSVQNSAVRPESFIAAEAFLRIPPFPGRKVTQFSTVAGEVSSSSIEELADQIRDHQVGGSYWAAQPSLPSTYVLARGAVPLDRCEAVVGNAPVVQWTERPSPVGVDEARLVVTGAFDPWHMLRGATALIVDTDDELVLIAALLAVPIYLRDAHSGRLKRQLPELARRLSMALGSRAVIDPFTGELADVRDAIELCGFWRRLIDGNRDIAGGFGFAFWKQENVGALLWGGAEPFRFFRTPSEVRDADTSVAVWRSRVPGAAIASLEGQGHHLIEVEDGFLRSRGLGADCVPPLSITVDRLGAYFDPAKPSELENIIQNDEFDQQLIERAGSLRKLIVEAGLSKYSSGGAEVHRKSANRSYILVPGQVEDDRSVETGGCGLATNLDLLIRVREEAPDAYILYKPHPDVVAGHRKGAIPDRICRRYADEIVTDAPIASLISMADEVHVNTSLAGFEALMRGKRVTTYGVPFYAGWGLTRDLGPVPARRTARRTLDELVAATLLKYPRYLDPVTGLPSPPEVVVARLSAEQLPDTNVVVAVRRLQGKLMRRMRSVVQ